MHVCYLLCTISTTTIQVKLLKRRNQLIQEKVEFHGKSMVSLHTPAKISVSEQENVYLNRYINHTILKKITLINLQKCPWTLCLFSVCYNAKWRMTKKLWCSIVCIWELYEHYTCHLIVCDIWFYLLASISSWSHLPQGRYVNVNGPSRVLLWLVK